MVRRVKKRGDTVEKATELGLGLLTGPSLKYMIKYKVNVLINILIVSVISIAIKSIGASFYQQSRNPDDHMTDVIGICQISGNQHLTGSYRKIKTP